MSFRKSAIALIVAAAAAPAAFANTGSTWVGGEAGFVNHPVESQLTRAQVQQEYLAFRSHPVSSDGTVFLDGELGYVSANQGAFADREPIRPHTHAMGNIGATAAPVTPVPLSDSERRAQQEQYLN